MNATMTVNGLTAVFHSPDALKDDVTGKAHRLPPYAPVTAYKVDDYNCPPDWMHGSPTASSYFVPVRDGKGMWLDFNGCWGHTHHVAVVVSVQGVNPLTGQPQVGQALKLERYQTNCPVHDLPFEADSYCPSCEYKWAPQNYLATTGTPAGQFWLDGFRAQDGEVRQYILTSEESRGVAAQVVGDRRVYAIGIAFFLSKEPKSVPAYTSRFPVFKYVMIPAPTPQWGMSEYQQQTNIVHPENMLRSMSLNSSAEAVSYNASEPAALEATHLEIGAGAKIEQQVYGDPNDLSFWQDQPAGMIYINYVTQDVCDSILAAGRRDRTKKGEGFLAGLKVGN